MLLETQALPDFEKYQSDPLYAYLNKKVIILPGKPPFVPERKLLIMESCGLLSFRRGNLKAEVGLRPADRSSFALEKLYVPLAACSFGDVPTADEFLALPDADIDIWINEARQINPQYFEWLDAAQKVVVELNEDRLKKRKEAAKIRKWISGLFESGTGNALPRFFEFSYEEFLRYKDDWLLWRNLGRVDGNGAWVAPVSFLEAQQLPDAMLSVFFALDNLTAKMAKQQSNKGKNK